MLNYTIKDAFPILSWEPDEKNLEKLSGIYDQYHHQCCVSFAVFLGKLQKSTPALYPVIKEKFEVLPEHLQNNFLLAPETSYRLFFHVDNINRIKDFIYESLTAELLKISAEKRFSRPLWTATGDYCFRYNNQHELRSLTMGKTVSIDFHSPYALGESVIIEDNGTLFFSETPQMYDDDQMFHVYRKLNKAYQLIGLVNTHITDVIDKFTRALVVRKDPSSDIAFTSASAGQYTGRTLIGNAHLDFVGEDLLSEALVHETIHSVLYMLERVQPWVPDRELYFDESVRVQSPWSGRQLRLRPFLQACFVWYGILRYWKGVLEADVVEEHIPQFYINIAKKGFLDKVELVDRVAQLRYGITDELLATITELQCDVRSSFN